MRGLIGTGPHGGKGDLPVFAFEVERFRRPGFDQEVFCFRKLSLTRLYRGAEPIYSNAL